MSTAPLPPERCLIIGDPVAHSLSPRMHSAGYRELGIAHRFTFEHQTVSSSDLSAFVNNLRSHPIRGAACTMPHKEALIGLVDRIDPIAARIGAINTILCEQGKVNGYNTDWLGIVNPLKERIDLNGKSALILGAGGAARAAIVGLLDAGVQITISNRTAEKSFVLATQFGIKSLDWNARTSWSDCDIIINTSALGMHPLEEENPLANYQFSSFQIVFETIYHPRETKLLKAAREAGAMTIEGLEMLLHQGLIQFELFTGEKAPASAMRQALEP